MGAKVAEIFREVVYISTMKLLVAIFLLSPLLAKSQVTIGLDKQSLLQQYKASKALSVWKEGVNKNGTSYVMLTDTTTHMSCISFFAKGVVHITKYIGPFEFFLPQFTKYCNAHFTLQAPGIWLDKPHNYLITVQQQGSSAVMRYSLIH